MPGRIRDSDVALVRERSDLAAVVGEQVALRNAGGGKLKGLCPFHDEKTPSFHVNPANGYYHCFGCGEGGDVIAFLRRTEHLSFPEAVERLAARAGITLQYEQGSAAPRAGGQRARLVEAHRVAADFYAEQLAAGGPDARVGVDFLAARGFDLAAAERFGVGYAPRGWDGLLTHLTGRGFTREELLAAGLVKTSSRGTQIDAFRGRLVWPVRDITGDVVGFGARRLHDDDPSPAKYLNTAETPIYRKSSLLYGVDAAKKEIARSRQAVIVEGYTDVMACHLAGVGTAVATCGTAFGSEHITVLRRLLMDQDELRGEVIFTFDGDEAGRKAALRAFKDDQRFVTQTFVAVQPDGLDPCDLRIRHGDAAVRDLVAARVPLFEFAVRSTMEQHNLGTDEGRLAALDAAAPIVAGIRDDGLRQRYAVSLDRWLGFNDEEFVRRRVAESARRVSDPARRGSGTAAPQQRAAATAVRPRPAPGQDPAAASVEREALKLAVQRPALLGAAFDALGDEVFTVAEHAAVHEAVAKAGGTTDASADGFVERVRDAAPDDTVRALVTALAVEPLLLDGEPDDRYAGAILARVQELAATRRIQELKSRVQRINPVERAEEYNRLYGELIGLEAYRRGLREQALGAL